MSSSQPAKHTQHHEKDPDHVAAGLKATINNPRVSAEAKHEAQNRLKEMGYEMKDPEHVKAGLKAAIHNPKVSAEAKAHAEKELKEMESGAHHTTSASHPHAQTQASSHESHVIGGYKATLHNPHTSPEAKKEAEKYLKDHGAL